MANQDEAADMPDQVDEVGAAATDTKIDLAVRSYFEANIDRLVGESFAAEKARLRKFAEDARAHAEAATAGLEHARAEIDVERQNIIAAAKQNFAESVSGVLAELQQRAAEAQAAENGLAQQQAEALAQLAAGIRAFKEAKEAELTTGFEAARAAALRNLEVTVNADLESLRATATAASEAVEANRLLLETISTRASQQRAEAETAWTAALQAAVANLASEVAASITGHRTAIAEAQAQIRATLEDFKQEFQTDTQLRASKTEDVLAQAKAEFTGVVTEYRDKVERAFAGTETRFSNLTGTTEEVVRDAIAKHQANLGSQEADGRLVLERLKELEQQVRDTAGVAGVVALSGHNRERAAAAGKAAWNWRIGATIAAAIGALAIGIFFFRFWWTSAADPSAGAVAMRLGLSVPIWVIFTYCASTASSFQKVADYNERIANELASMGPYLAPLVEADRNQIKGKLADRYFGAGNASAVPSGRSTLAVATEVADAAKALVKPVAEATQALNK